MDFAAGDIGYGPRGNAHSISNVGGSDRTFVETFRSPYFSDVSLSDWLTHAPPALVARHLDVDADTIKAWSNDKSLVMPK